MMDLAYTPQQDAFRAEVRDWLEAHVPPDPLRSFDTREGFEAHRDWERELHAGGCSSSLGPARRPCPAPGRPALVDYPPSAIIKDRTPT